MQQKSKYNSIQALINLPPLRPLKKQDQTIFLKNNPNANEQKYLNEEIISTRDLLIDKIEKQLWIFTDINYDFKFPTSKFPNVQPDSMNNISYERKLYRGQQQDTFQARLNSQQIQQIKYNGQFQVNSQKEKAHIPYTWKINQCLFRGQVGRLNIWEDGLSCCYTLLNDAYNYFKQYVPKSFKTLAYLPIKLFALIFGLCSQFSTINLKRFLEQYYEQLAERYQIVDRTLASIIFYLEYGPQIYQIQHGNTQEQNNVIQMKTNEYNLKKSKITAFKQKIRSIQTNFKSDWIKIRKNILSKISSDIDEPAQKSMVIEAEDIPLKDQTIKSKDRLILNKLFEEKYLIYSAYMKENLPKQKVSNGVIQAILTLFTLVSLIQAKLKIKNDRLAQHQSKIRQEIKQKYSIRVRNSNFEQSTFLQIYQPIRDQIQIQFFENLLSDANIQKFFNQKYKKIYQKYVEFNKNHKNLIKQKQKILKTLYLPQRVFRTSYILFPPYQVQYKNQIYYLKTQQIVETDTSTHFWKCCLYAMRLKSWSLNSFKLMIGAGWASPLGFRCLFGFEDFAYDEYLPYHNIGIKQDIKRTPLLGIFGKVIKGIYESRDAFQALPDRGIFGKNCSRLCNLIQCYVLRLFFVGIIGVLMLYPVAIIIFSTFCFVIGITFWIWVPMAMIVVYLFNILVFQFQISYQYSQCIIRTFPLISLFGLLIFHIFRIIGLTLYLVLIAPIISLLYIIFLVLQRIFRTISDTIILCFIRCCGRTPSSDSSIAKKISGPGMSRDYFYSIAQQDVYVLVQSELQKIFVNKFIELTLDRIQVNIVKYTNICQFVFKPFGYTVPKVDQTRDFVNLNNNQLIQKFNKKAQNYMKRYPKYPYNVRFTQEQILIYFENLTKIVKNFVEKQKIKDWIFQSRQILIQDYDQLTRNIWQNIFQCGQLIFEPLENIDTRFKLIDDDNTNSSIMKQRVGSIVKVLQGEVQLKHIKVTFTQAKRSLLQKDFDFLYIDTICAMHNQNSGLQIRVNINDPSTILIPHRNLKQLMQYDKYTYQRMKNSSDKIIQDQIRFID